jgi:hypothetical protein
MAKCVFEYGIAALAVALMLLFAVVEVGTLAPFADDGTRFILSIKAL